MCESLTVEQLMKILERLNPEDSLSYGVVCCKPCKGDLCNVSLIKDDNTTTKVYKVFQMLNDTLNKTIEGEDLMCRTYTKDCKVYLNYEGCYGKVITGIELTLQGLSFKTGGDFPN